MDVNKIREESAIYKGLKHGCFLYEYRSKLNQASFEICMENPTLLKDKGYVCELAKQKVDRDGYSYKKKKSRSSSLEAEGRPEKQVKSTPAIRSRHIKEKSEDLEEVKNEIMHLDNARKKARNVNKDERALHLTKELQPLREKQRQLERELELLQQKDKKSSKDKERRKQRQGQISSKKKCKPPSSSTTQGIDSLLKKLQSSGGDAKIPEPLESDVVTPDPITVDKNADEICLSTILPDSQGSPVVPPESIIVEDSAEGSTSVLLSDGNHRSSPTQNQVLQDVNMEDVATTIQSASLTDNSASQALQYEESLPSESESFLVSGLDSQLTVQNLENILP